MASEFPTKYTDPLYASLDAKTEQKLGLPVGLLASVRTNGERSNHDQTNNLGTFGVYQFIPATRQAILKKYGLDVTLSPENAAEGAGLLLKEGMDRNKGDAAASVGEYIGGLDRSNWGKTTNAYINRVMVGQTAAKTGALDNGFAKWMADNPAKPTAPAQPAATTESPLSAGFGQWLQAQQAPQGAAAIPTEPGANLTPTPQADPSLVERIIGAGEAGLSTATSLTGGALGMAGGTVKGLAGAVMDGTYGTPQGAQQVEQAASDGASALTYQPRTPQGQAQTEAVGSALASAIPVMPLTGELQLLGRAGANAAPAAIGAARSAGNAVATGAREAGQAIGAKAQSLRQSVTGAEPRTAGGNMSAAATDMTTLRDVQAASLPVPVELTRGAASRDAAQLGFEKEQMKSAEMGGPLRDRAEQNSHQIMQNFDAFVDQTGAVAPDIHAASKSVVNAIAQQAARDKTEIRTAYAKAEKAGEMATPVSLGKLVDYLNESAPDAATAPLLTTARAQAVKLGIAEDVGGRLVATRGPGAGGSSIMNNQPVNAVTLKTAETFRQAINRNTDFEPTNIRQATIIKKLIDEATEGQGGDIYRQARVLRTNYARKYENRAAVADLITNRKGMDDPKVAIDKVFDRSVMQGSADELRFLRRVLQTSGEDGRQAWKELQGATINHIREASTALAKDSLDRDMVSTAKLNAVIKRLDKDGKLEIMFGKKGAETMRTLNEVVAYVNTVPPGTLINSSGTAGTLMAAMAEMGVSGTLIGLPLPVMTGLRQIARSIKDVKLKNRINAALAAPKNQ